MHDVLHRAYACPDGPSLPRASTEELLMQVYVNGRWHRRMPDLQKTACDVVVDSPRSPVRRPELAGDLCPACHHAAELARAAENNQKDFEP